MSSAPQKTVGQMLDEILDDLPGETPNDVSETPEDGSDLLSDMDQVMKQAVHYANTMDSSVLRQNMITSLNDPEGLVLLKAQVSAINPLLTTEQIDQLFVPENFDQLIEMAMATANQLKQ